MSEDIRQVWIFLISLISGLRGSPAQVKHGDPYSGWDWWTCMNEHVLRDTPLQHKYVWTYMNNEHVWACVRRHTTAINMTAFELQEAVRKSGHCGQGQPAWETTSPSPEKERNSITWSFSLLIHNPNLWIVPLFVFSCRTSQPLGKDWVWCGLFPHFRIKCGMYSSHKVCLLMETIKVWQN